MRVGIVGGSIAGCAAAALLRRANHDVTVLERSESELVSRGAGILSWTAAWQHMAAHGLFDESLPAGRADHSRLVTRAPGTGQERWLGDYELSFTLFNWAHLYQQLRRRVPDEVYRSGTAVERIEATPHGATLHLTQGDPREYDLVVCADGYRSLGRGIVDPGAIPTYRNIVLWRGLLPERDIHVDVLSEGDILRPVYQGGHGIVYYIPGAEPGERLLMWGYYLQVPERELASVLVDDQERQQSGSVPFGKVHPEVRAALESRLAGLLPSSLFELVHQSSNSSIQAIYSCVPRRYVRERLCLVGDAGTVLPPFAGAGVLRAITSVASLVEAAADAEIDDALRRWNDAQLQAAAAGIPNTEAIERNYVFDVPDLTTMPTAATNEWMTTAFAGLPLTLPDPGPPLAGTADAERV
jgi:2-polyprenyl-6-methoxyphenol hydroxylase-like FAD-dependent oxidoreductase